MKYRECFCVNENYWNSFEFYKFGKQKIQCRFRYDPIPKTGKYYLKFNNYYRHIKTTQEKRWNCTHKNYIRNKRSNRNLSEYWDDLLRSDYKNNNWKVCSKRKHQYK